MNRLTLTTVLKSYDPAKPLFSLHIPKTGGSSLQYVLDTWFSKHRFINLRKHPKLSTLLTLGNFDLTLQRLLGCGLYYHYKDHKRDVPARVIPLGKRYGLFRRQPISECVHGHFQPYRLSESVFDYYPDASQFIMTLRDPLEMQISLFHYVKHLIASGNMHWDGQRVTAFNFNDIDDWVTNRDSYLLSLLPWKLAFENYKDIINANFVHICVIENYQRSIDILAAKLGYPSVQVPTTNITPKQEFPSQMAIEHFKQKHSLEYAIYDYACQLNQSS